VLTKVSARTVAEGGQILEERKTDGVGVSPACWEATTGAL